uniref:Isoform 2 of B-cell antigen receptor complex-associated protein alpha chain n=1 Tax=Bos taurus TaxID=9913 RepID=P40293-2|nr:mb-1 [Bos taurus]
MPEGPQALQSPPATIFLLLISAAGLGPGCQALWVEWGPPSVTVSVGEEVRLQCTHNGSNTNVTWWHVLQSNSSWPPVMYRGDVGAGGELIIKPVNKTHRGMYRCQVSDGKKIQRSCGTYLRVRETMAEHEIRG